MKAKPCFIPSFIDSQALIGVPENIVTSQSYNHISGMDIDDYFDDIVYPYFEDLFNLF